MFGKLLLVQHVIIIFIFPLILILSTALVQKEKGCQLWLWL